MSGVKEAILNDAKSVIPSKIATPKVDIDMAVSNARYGVMQVDQHGATLEALYTKYEAAGPRLLLLLEMLVEATEAVDLARPQSQEVVKLSAPVFADRQVLMAQLIAWQITGLVPKAEADRIREGRGLIDAARDVIAIAKLTNKYPVTKPKLMTSPLELKEMVKRAEALLAVVKKEGTPTRRNDAFQKALDHQSRIWTLVVRQHEVLWKHGVELFGKEVDAHVPPLGSRAATRKKSVTDPVVAPAPA